MRHEKFLVTESLAAQDAGQTLRFQTSLLRSFRTSSLWRFCGWDQFSMSRCQLCGGFKGCDQLSVSVAKLLHLQLKLLHLFLQSVDLGNTSCIFLVFLFELPSLQRVVLRHLSVSFRLELLRCEYKLGLICDNRAGRRVHRRIARSRVD